MLSLTTATLVNIHRGVALPAARVIVVAVPLAVLATLLWLRRRP